MNISKCNNYMMQKRFSVIVDVKSITDLQTTPVNPNIVFGALANLDTWNVTVSKELLEALLKLSESEFIDNYYNPLIETIKYMKGDDVCHDHFVFQNFPDSCRSLSSNELSTMRFVRYYTVLFDEAFGTDLTNQIMDGEKPENIEREPLKSSELETISLATMEDFYSLNENLLGSKSALSILDKEIIDFAIREKDISNKKIIPAEIPFKETMALMLKYDMELSLHLDLPFASYIDFKRAVVALSDEEISHKRLKLRKFSSAEKKYLLGKLHQAYQKNPVLVTEQMYKDRQFLSHMANYWKTNRYETRYPQISKIISQIYDNKYQMTTSAAKKEAMVLDKDALGLSKLLNSHPGEYFRKLNFMLEHAKNDKETDIILTQAKEIAIKVPNNMLLSTNATISGTLDPNIIRTAFPKGNTRKALQYESFKKPLSETVIAKVDDICKAAIIERLSKKLDFSKEKIFISEDMKLCPVPFGVKDESVGGRTLTKGTKFTIDQKETSIQDVLKEKSSDILRLFVYKEIPETGGFVDLSVSFLDKNCELVDQCSWTNLKTSNSGRPLAIHSGDGYDCKKGLSEFIDIDLSVLDEYSKNKQVAYLAMQVLSYSGIPFKNMKRCFAGMMKVNDMINQKVEEHERYKIFDPKLVKSKMDLTGSETVCIPLVYDVESQKCVVADIATGQASYEKKSKYKGKTMDDRLLSFAEKHGISPTGILAYPTLESCHDLVSNVTRNIINNHYPNLHELFYLAAIAGGATEENFTNNKAEATISFAWDGTITPYDRDVITKTFMTVEKEYEETLDLIDPEKSKQQLEQYHNLTEVEDLLVETTMSR